MKVRSCIACSYGGRMVPTLACCCCCRPSTSSAGDWTSLRTSPPWLSNRTPCLLRLTGKKTLKISPDYHVTHTLLLGILCLHNILTKFNRNKIAKTWILTQTKCSKSDIVYFFVIVAFEISLWSSWIDFYMIQFVLISQISFYCFEAKYASICWTKCHCILHCSIVRRWYWQWCSSFWHTQAINN